MLFTEGIHRVFIVLENLFMISGKFKYRGKSNRMNQDFVYALE